MMFTNRTFLVTGDKRVRARVESRSENAMP
ncbi:hypothetical protein FDG2_0374 [Candidatus Protofrankia californiensis]|uniref:Uncharacterized protein n=1 Tax=Candidatus Protofrankia californiensis TaxID=1839754 RepID=A0A1C3NTF5_9ACTN|nr:hypothetical protein FDG2_0374 [Candidatus Protofrankia californiensis]